MTTLGSIGAAATSETTSGSISELSETYDVFLKLLTVQMQSQDPLDPMDNSEYINQLVEFTQAEQAVGTNNRLDELIGLEENNALNDAVAYIGQTVRADSSVAGLVDGQSTLVYALFSNAAETEILITDEGGNAVRTLEGETETGLHTIVWDGLDDHGKPLEDGIYNFEVIAKDMGGTALTTAQGVEGEITGLEMNGSQVVLRIGEVEILPASISAILPTSEKKTAGLDDLREEVIEEVSEEVAGGLIDNLEDAVEELLDDAA